MRFEIQKIIEELREELWDTVLPQINTNRRRREELYTEHIKELDFSIIGLENRFKLIQESIGQLQKLCQHDWDEGEWDHRTFIITCKICKLQEER